MSGKSDKSKECPVYHPDLMSYALMFVEQDCLATVGMRYFVCVCVYVRACMHACVRGESLCHA